MLRIIQFSILYIIAFLLFFAASRSQTPAAENLDAYIGILKNKKVGLVANHTSIIKDKHLLDVLIDNGIEVVAVYAPEHGFRGKAEAGEVVNHSIDSKTSIKIISLYGRNKKPSKDQLLNVDYMVFDMQDVGVRFYTYLSTMHYVMEACAENGIPLMVLDRPNPNGFYVDGPVLETDHKSFVGMHPIPIVHGMTLGELAEMINGEGWLLNKLKCTLYVVKCKDYNHQSHYKLPVNPSPNLKTMNAIYLYPSLCLFEGTALSVGRGTIYPFEVFGHPNYNGNKRYSFSFIPKGVKGAPKPLFDGVKCYGIALYNNDRETTNLYHVINLDWILQAYKDFEPKKSFFNSFFYKLSGTKQLREQIEEGKTADEIRASWQRDLEKFKQLRKKYLIYN